MISGKSCYAADKKRGRRKAQLVTLPYVSDMTAAVFLACLYFSFFSFKAIQKDIK